LKVQFKKEKEKKQVKRRCLLQMETRAELCGDKPRSVEKEHFTKQWDDSQTKCI
jgi:hypothetical protein